MSLGILAVQFGAPGDIPLPADFNNDGFTDYGIWQPHDGRWWVLSGADRFTPLVINVPWGQYGDCPVPGRLLGSGPGPLELNVWRPANGLWYYGVSLERDVWNIIDDSLAVGRYGAICQRFPLMRIRTAMGATIAIYRPSTGTWWVRTVARRPIVTVGDSRGPAGRPPGDIPNSGRFQQPDGFTDYVHLATPRSR